MMLRKILVTAGGISLCCLLAALANPANASSRTLHPNELWAAYGGGLQSFDDRCCDQLGICVASMLLCDMNKDEQNCVGAEEEANPQELYHDEGCNTGPKGTQCVEDTDKNVCLLIYDCEWDGFSMECGQGQQSGSKSAPQSCIDDCPKDP